MHLHFVSYYVPFRHTVMASRLLQASPLFATGRLTMERLKELARRYFVALLAPAAIALVMQVTWPFFQSAPVAPYFVAVIFCAWYGGLRPGLLSVLISFFLSDFLFIEPYFFFWPSKEFNLGRILLFAVVGPFISVMSELMHRERGRAEINLESARQAVEAWRQSDANYRVLFEGSALPMWVYDIETLAFLAVNEAAVHHYGYSRAEFLALTIVDIRPPEDVPAFRAALADAAAGFSAVANTWRHTKKDGSIIEVETTHSLLDFAGRPARLVLANDVTKRKRAEGQLKATSEQLRALSARLQSAKEEEGTRIARELHDELGSALTSLRWSLDEIDSLLSTALSKVATDTLREKIATMTRLVEGTLQTVRRISSELRPGILDEVGLIAAIEWEAQKFEARTGILCYFDSLVENVSLTREQSTALFRIFQEALTNILRHAKATRVDIAAAEREGEFVLTIKDNGRGIIDEEKSGEKSLGLLGMRERAYLIGGEVNITGVAGQGTVVTVRVPVPAPQTFEE